MSPQSSIGHYRITSKLGEGGMGAVFVGGFKKVLYCREMKTTLDCVWPTPVMFTSIGTSAGRVTPVSSGIFRLI